METLRIFISAGEPSGDILAAELLAALHESAPMPWQAFGICGPRMREQGAEAIFQTEDLAVMGFVEVMKHLPFLSYMESELLEQINRRQPQIAILVDYPGLHLRLAAVLKARGVYVIQYVAPQLWAWGEKRTARLRAVTDLVLGIMPFEQDFFQRRAVNYRYVGTPQVDRASAAKASKSVFGFAESEKVIGFFPGSRRSEIERLLPRHLEARQQLRQLMPEARFAVSLAPHLKPELFAPILGIALPPPEFLANGAHLYRLGDTHLIRGQSLDLMKSVDSALVTSGTATLECALCETAMAVSYVMHPLSYQLAKRFVTLPSISLVNLVAETALVREFIQNWDALEMAKHLLALTQEGPERTEHRRALQALHAKLQGNPARHAAEAVGDVWRGLLRFREESERVTNQS